MAETPLEREPPALPLARARAFATRLGWPLAVILVVLLGGLLRFHGLGWDQPKGASAPLQMHPDERFLSIVSDKIDWPSGVGEYFDTAHSPLNPYNAPETPSFVYGTFPLFLVKAVSTWAGDDAAGTGNGYEKTVIWGRRLTALFETATIAVVFGIGAQLFGRRAGLLASLLYALAVLPTQLAHFWAADPYLVFFTCCALLCAILYIKSARDWQAWLLGAGMGAALGLAMASKVNALLFVPMVPAAALIRIGVRDFGRLGLRWRGERPRAGHWMTDLSVVCFALAVGILVFRVAQPYAFTGPGLFDMRINEYWRQDIFKGEWERQKGEIDFPPFVQFAGRAPLLYPLENLVLWGLGPALGIAAIAACAVAAVLLFRRRDLAFALPLVIAAGVFGVQGVRFVTYMRYFAPIYPLLCVMAGWALAGLWRFARRGEARDRALPRVRLLRGRQLPGRWQRIAAGAAAAFVLLATAWWAMAFQGVYSAEHPRIAASKWIYANVPQGSRITGELWDDTLPYVLPGTNPAQYTLVELTPYDTDSPQKISQLVYGGPGPHPSGGLVSADYVSISSNRVRSSVTRLEREYPAQIRFYQLLDSGELGFELVAHFRLRPSFLGISVDDSSAEESFTVYDHPEVRIYKKTAAFDPAKALALLAEAHPERAVNLLPRQGRTNGLMQTADEAATQQAGGTFDDAFARHGFTSRHLPWAWWLAWLEVAAFATLPALSWLFRALPDRGYGLSKLAGLTAVALPTWLLVAWGGPHFSGGLAWLVFAALVAGGLALGFVRRRTLLAEAKARWPMWLAMECAFLLAFFAFLTIRYFNPDLWHPNQGGEKPVELAYLTAVARSTILPPYDPWFAGGTMNYYYMGWFFLAVPMRALRIVPEVGFNLGVPTFAALAAVTACSIVCNLVAVTRSGASGVGRRAGAAVSRVRPAIIAGLFAGVLLIGIGNLDGAHQTVERLQKLNTVGESWGNSTPDVPVLGRPIRWAERVAGGTAGATTGLWQSLVDDRQLPPFDWWRSSRVHIGQFDITEFPYFSALFADLHPHLMGLPFFGAVIALAAAYVASTFAGLRRQAWALAAAMGVVLGLVRTVHTWDFPTAVLLGSAGIVAGQVLRAGRWQQRWWDAVAHLVLAAGVLTVLFAPYTAHFEVFQSGIMKAPETTKANQYFAHFGVFVAFTIAFVVVRYHEVLAARRGNAGRNPVLALVAGKLELGALAVFLVGLTAFTWQFDWWWMKHDPLPGTTMPVETRGVTVVALSAVLLLFLANLLWIEWRAKERDPARLLVTAILGAAVGIAAGVDLVTVKNDIVRMNTVFKFSLQAWQLYALGSAYAGWYCGQALWRADGWRTVPRPGRHAAAWAGAVAAAVLLFAASLYLVSGTRARQQARFAKTPHTLDGQAYFAKAVYYEDHGTPDQNDDQLIALEDDKPLIDWLRANVHGSPVITEAIGPLYHWPGRISWNTGLPAVVGWDWHAIAYRMDYAYLVQQRRLDTQRFYTETNTSFAAFYLRKYDVKYVVIGTEEHVFGTPQGLASLASMPQLRAVFRSGSNAIYEVRPECLPWDEFATPPPCP